MFKLLFTLDYEIHGNGEGLPCDLLLEPTGRMMSSFEKFGAKLSIMADVAEILKFKEYDAKTASRRFSSRAIEEQLQDAIRRGHDVQLHLHTSYFGAVFEHDYWKQDYALYDLAGIPYEQISPMVQKGKEYLTSLLKPVEPSYRCIAFRAANWSMIPSRNIIRALVENDILIDTSVFKWGNRKGMVNFDYSDAFHPLFPWPTHENNICSMDLEGKLFEFPIYCEPRSIISFLTMNRLYNHYQNWHHPLNDAFKKGTAQGIKGNAPEKAVEDSARRLYGNSAVRRAIGGLTKKRPWKLDFNQCTSRQLIEACEDIITKYGATNSINVPIVLIGHSKLYTRENDTDLQIFLDYIAHRDGLAFGLFSDFNLDTYRSFYLRT